MLSSKGRFIVLSLMLTRIIPHHTAAWQAAILSLRLASAAAMKPAGEHSHFSRNEAA
jgi:hypothetical protein